MTSRNKAIFLLASVSLVACTNAEFRPRAVGDSFAGVSDAAELLAEGRLQFRNRNFALAVNSFRRALRQEPQSVDALNGLAASYDRLGRFDLARRYYEEALAVAPADPRVRHNFALSLRMQGLYADAARLEAEGRESDPAPRQQLADRGPSDSVTIVLPPSMPAEPVPDARRALPRLERISTAEVALITRSGADAPAAREPERRVETVEAGSIPVRTVRDTSREVVIAIGEEPASAARPAPLPRTPAPRQAEPMRVVPSWPVAIASEAARPAPPVPAARAPVTPREIGPSLVRAEPAMPRPAPVPRTPAPRQAEPVRVVPSWPVAIASEAARPAPPVPAARAPVTPLDLGPGLARAEPATAPPAGPPAAPRLPRAVSLAAASAPEPARRAGGAVPSRPVPQSPAAPNDAAPTIALASRPVEPAPPVPPVSAPRAAPPPPARTEPPRLTLSRPAFTPLIRVSRSEDWRPLNRATQLAWQPLRPAVPQAALAQARIPMRILNAVGRRGQAARMQAHLRHQGWSYSSIGDARSRRLQSIVLSPPGTLRQAQALAASLPFRARIVRTTRYHQLYLVLGRNALPFDDRLRQGGAQS